MSKNEQCRVVKYLVRRHLRALHLVGKSCGEVRINTCHTVDQQALTRAFVKLILFIWSRSTIGRVERDERIGMPGSPGGPFVPGSSLTKIRMHTMHLKSRLLRPALEPGATFATRRSGVRVPLAPPP